MGQGGGEVVTVAGVEDADLAIHPQLDGATGHQATFFALGMHDRLTGIGTWRIQLAQHAHLPAFDTGADQQHAQATVAKVGLLVGAEHKALFADRLVETEELRQRHRNAFKQFFQGTDRRADAILLDLRDRRVGQATAPSQLPLGEFVAFTHQFESCPRVHSRLIYRKFFGGALKHIP
ncbi:hypothetical protein D3C79_575170 [compost metagenome]